MADTSGTTKKKDKKAPLPTSNIFFFLWSFHFSHPFEVKNGGITGPGRAEPSGRHGMMMNEAVD